MRDRWFRSWPFATALFSLSLAAACTKSAPAAYGSALIRVDTDVAVPRLVSSLRVDVFLDDGTWIDSRDFPIRDPALMPASFVVFSPSGETSSRALVRVRSYGDGDLIDVAPSNSARLLRDGLDVTPTQEPDPSLSIDRLLRVEVQNSESKTVNVHLLGACAGVPANLIAVRSCRGADRTLSAPSSDSDDGPSPLVVGAFGASDPAGLPTPRTPEADDDGGEAVITGGAFILGSDDLAVNSQWGGQLVSATPRRLVAISSLLVDRFEVSVGRFRRAIAQGFAPPTRPTTNDSAFPKTTTSASSTDELCSFSTAPLSGAAARESMPLNCVDYQTAQAFCAFMGGDLPTEAEWEYIAAAASRPNKTLYPFGDDDVGCGDAVFARTTLLDDETARCSRLEGWPIGPAAVGSAPLDVVNDVHDLGGNLSEWTRDSYRSYGDACWIQTSQRDPSCIVDPLSGKVVSRGGAFTEPAAKMLAALRKPVDSTLPFAGLGFRCVRRHP